VFHHPPFDGEILPSITVSIGVGQFQLGESMADLIDRCDRALYLAKRTGRKPGRDRERTRTRSPAGRGLACPRDGVSGGRRNFLAAIAPDQPHPTNQ